MLQRVSQVRRTLLGVVALALVAAVGGSCTHRRPTVWIPRCAPERGPRFAKFTVENRTKYWRVEAPETGYWIEAQQNVPPFGPLTVHPTASSDVAPNSEKEFDWCRYLGEDQLVPECDHRVRRIFDVQVVLVNVTNGTRYAPPPFNPPECANSNAGWTCQLILTLEESPDPMAFPLVHVTCSDSCL